MGDRRFGANGSNRLQIEKSKSVHADASGLSSRSLNWLSEPKDASSRMRGQNATSNISPMQQRAFDPT
jgi:hypothetical protein